MRGRARLPETMLDRALARIDSSDGPVVVGPWHSEVGFEVLYWIPFLRQLVRDGRVDPARLVAVSRGGVADWYRGICDGYVELLSVVSPEEYHRLGEERRTQAGGQKQGTITRWDEWLLERAGPVAGWKPGDPLLHPSLMYEPLRRFWKGGEPLGMVLGQLAFERWHPPEGELDVPESFVAAKVYFSDPFPDTAENRSFAAQALASLASRTPVVLLQTGARLDEHDELSAADGVTVLAGPPEENLGLQSLAVSRASAFVGTYGGFSYLASAYGVPGLSFVSDPTQFFPAHLDVARRAAAALGTPFSLFETGALDSLAVLEVEDAA